MPALAQPPTQPATPDRPLRWPQAALLACAVLALHAGALRGLGGQAASPGPRATAPGAFQVRQVLPTAAANVLPEGAITSKNSPTTSAAVPAKEPATRTEWSAARPDSGRPSSALPAADRQMPAQAPTAAPPGAQVPIYATQPAPAATLVYEMKRGGRTGLAELRWRPAGGRYGLELDATGFGPQAPGSASEGSFDAAGLSPERHVDRRRGRDQRAVNFQREGGFISFSGPQLTHTLQPGAQDRLSWMLQLPAILQANPALATEGAQISLWVASARGESDVWTFTVQGSEALDLPGGRVEAALRLLRRPLRPYDTQVEVWLDPARQHLPVQLLLALRPGGEPTELRLQSLSLP
jgi:hypothetical protein